MNGLRLGWLLLFCLAPAPSRADWPFVWDFGGGSDEAIAARLGPDGDLWVLSESHLPGVALPRAVLLRIDANGGLAWATDDPPLETMVMPRRYDLGPDPYARYRPASPSSQ